MKRYSTSLTIKEMKMKTKLRYHYIHLTEQQQQKIVTTLNAGKDMVVIKNGLAVSYKISHATTMEPRKRPPGHLTYKNENLWSHKNLYPNVYSSFIFSSPGLEVPQTSSDSWMVKLTVVHPSTEYLPSNKKELLKHVMAWGNHQRITLSEEKRQFKTYFMRYTYMNRMEIYIYEYWLEIKQLYKWWIV